MPRTEKEQRITQLKRAYLRACVNGGSTKHYIAVTKWLRREIARYEHKSS